MNEEKLLRILANGQDAVMKGAADMWRNAIADTVLILLEADEPITRDTLRQGLQMQITQQDNPIRKATLLGALNVLNGRLPRD